MTRLPEQWEQIHLDELAALKTGPFGSALHKSDYRTGGIPVVNPMHIVGGKIGPSAAVTVAPETAERLSEFRVQRGDIILGRRGEMGRCAVVREAEHGWLCGTGSLIVRPGTALDPYYMQRFLSSPDIVSRLEEASVGSTMVNLNQRILLQLEMPIPPLAEQKRHIKVTLDNSVPFGGADGQTPAWQIDFDPDSVECTTWDDVFHIRERIKRDVLDPSFRQWLGNFSAWFKKRRGIADPGDAEVLDAIRTYAEDLMLMGLTACEFLRAPVFQMLHRYCASGDQRVLTLMKNVVTMAVP